MLKFTATIQIIGVNPFVFLPKKTLNTIFKQAGKDKGKIPVKMKIDGHKFNQTLIKYSGEWRLYLNTPMRKAAQKDVGDTAIFEIEFDAEDRKIPIHPKLNEAFQQNEIAKIKFDNLPASRQLEIVRYISNLKTAESIEKNVLRAINFLLEKERFIGREKP